MTDQILPWRPAAMNVVETERDAPPGFTSVVLAGIGLKAEMYEPIDASNWQGMVDGLEPWGDIPSDISVEEVVFSERGPIVKISSNEGSFNAEILPWGSDGRLKARVSIAPKHWDLPQGGYNWNGEEIILIRNRKGVSNSLADSLNSALAENNLSDTSELLSAAGECLGEFHTAADQARVTPPDPNRWNKRLEGLEARLRANTIWRAPHTKMTECILSLGDVRFSDIRQNDGGAYGIKIAAPRLADCLYKPDCEFPAIRDFACLMHDLSRSHYDTNSTLDLCELRKSLIEGWRKTAPKKWSSKKAFYTPKGGVFFWEYEQNLLDVIEAVSHQSGKPEPAVSIIKYVPLMQKTMFNSRLLAAFSFITGFFSFNGIYHYFTGVKGDLLMPVVMFSASVGLFLLYKRSAPPPEIPIQSEWKQEST